MKAARYYGRHDLRVERVDEPGEPEPGQVLVKPSFCGICGTDLHEYESGPIFTPKAPNRFSGATLPQILGHEFSGTVMAVGPGVKAVRLGQRVSILSRKSAPATTTLGAATSVSLVPRPLLSD